MPFDAAEESPQATRILFVAKSDGIGGVERQIAGLIATLAEHRVVCDLVTLIEPVEPAGLLSHIPKTVLDVRVRSGPIRRLLQMQHLRRIIGSDRYRAVIGFGPSPNALVALSNRRRGPLAVISEVGDPFIERRRHWNRWWMWSYRRADVLVVLTERLAAEFRAVSRRPPRVVAIPNMVSPLVALVEPTQPREPVIAGLGRLVPSKRYGDLVEAFARLGPAADEWKIVLVGDGDDRAHIEQLADSLGIGDRVEITGWSPTPWETLSVSSIFVLCSQHEGFATVLLEACASGCAVISSDCRFGPREILDGGEAGRLYPVGDIDALTELLTELIGDPVRRLTLAHAAHERVQHFDADSVTAKWMELISAESTA